MVFVQILRQPTAYTLLSTRWTALENNQGQKFIAKRQLDFQSIGVTGTVILKLAVILKLT